MSINMSVPYRAIFEKQKNGGSTYVRFIKEFRTPTQKVAELGEKGSKWAKQRIRIKKLSVLNLSTNGKKDLSATQNRPVGLLMAQLDSKNRKSKTKNYNNFMSRTKKFFWT